MGAIDPSISVLDATVRSVSCVGATFALSDHSWNSHGKRLVQPIVSCSATNKLGRSAMDSIVRITSDDWNFELKHYSTDCGDQDAQATSGPQTRNPLD